MTDAQRKHRKLRGPAPLPADQVRSRRIVVFVNDVEHVDLRARAESAGMKPPEFMRAAALQSWPPIPPRVPELNQRAWFELARAAANLNQLAHAFNESGDLADIEQARRELVDFRAAIVGASHIEDERR